MHVWQARLDPCERAQDLVAVALELTLGLFEAFELHVQRVFFGDLVDRARFERGEVAFTGHLFVCEGEHVCGYESMDDQEN